MADLILLREWLTVRLPATHLVRRKRGTDESPCSFMSGILIGSWNTLGRACSKPAK
jgi:hypothetical protein